MHRGVLSACLTAALLCAGASLVAAQQPGSQRPRRPGMGRPAMPGKPADTTKAQPGVQAQQGVQEQEGQQGPQGGGPGTLLEKGLVGALVERPEALHLTATQLTRTRVLAKWLEERNAPLHAQMMQVTGGRAMRDIPPVERRRLGQQLRPLMDQMRGNDLIATDSLKLVLAPDQLAQLDSLGARIRAGAPGAPRGPARDSMPQQQGPRRPRRP